MKKNNLFIGKSKWFRYTDYEIVEHKFENTTRKLIKPTKNSHIQWYDPFGEFPDILKDFYKLLNTITSKRCYSNELLKFTKMYGPLGIYWLDIKQDKKNPRQTSVARKVIGEEEINNWSETLIKQYFTSNYAKVLNYVKKPNLILELLLEKKDYLDIDTSTIKFLKGYTETPTFIRYNPKLRKIINAYIKDEELFVNENIGITKENGFTQLAFDCPTLLDAIISMYIMNKSNLTGDYKVKKCKREGCRNSFIVGKNSYNPSKKYCSESCGNSKRVNNSRSKYGFNHLYYLPKLINGNITIEKLSEKQNVSINSIITAIESYDPKGEEMKKKLKKFKKTLDKCPTN